MTRSSRRMDTIAGRSKWSATNKKCEECNGNMVKVGINLYVCTKCGLKQRSEVKRKLYFRKYTTPKYLQKVEKQWEGKNALTPTVYDKAKINKTKHIEHNKSKNITPKLAKIKPFKCSECNKICKTQQSLDQHYEAKHYKLKRVDKRNIVFCDKCNNLLSVSSKRDKLICGVCGFSKPIS